jgi:hypothetical protein
LLKVIGPNTPICSHVSGRARFRSGTGK